MARGRPKKAVIETDPKDKFIQKVKYDDGTIVTFYYDPKVSRWNPYMTTIEETKK